MKQNDLDHQEPAMDTPLFNVLEKSGHLVYLGYFAVNSEKNRILIKATKIYQNNLGWTRDRLLQATDLKKVMDEILPKKIARRNGIIEEIINELKSSNHDIQPFVKKEEEVDIPVTSSNIEDEVPLIERTNDETSILATSNIEDEVLLIERTDNETIILEDEEGDIDNQMNIADATISLPSVPSKIFSASPGGIRSMLLSPDNPGKNRVQVDVSPKRAVIVRLISIMRQF